MDVDKGITRIGKLIRRRRTALGLTRAQVSQRSGISRSTLAAIEQGRHDPSLGMCLKLAPLLGVAQREMLDARALDELREQPAALADLEQELSCAAWREAASHRLRVVQGDVRLLVDDDGTLGIERSYRGCTSTRARKTLVFRDRIIGQQPVEIEIQRTPIDYRLSSQTIGQWCEHRIEFREPWAKGSLDIRFRVTLPRAYVRTDFEEFNRRQKVAGLPQQSEPRGAYQYYLLYAFEYLTLTMRFPASYQLDWADPIATPDRAAIEDADYLGLDEIAMASEWVPGASEGCLRLRRPVPSNSVFLNWYSRT